MRFIGADLHEKSITFCVVEFTAAGEISVVQRHRIPCCDVALGDRPNGAPL